MTTAATTPPAPTKDESAYGEMASVFDSLVDPLNPEEKPAEDTAPTKADEAAAEPGAAETAPPATEGNAQPSVEGTQPPSEGAEGESTPEAASPPTSAGEETPAGGPEAVDWEAKYRELEAQRAVAPEAKPPVETPPEDTAPPTYSKEETEFLDQYAKDWPDIIKGEALRRRAEYIDLVNHVFKEISRVYGPLVERGAAAAEQVAENATIQAIRDSHSDYSDAMHDDIVAWTDSLTGFRQRYAKQVIENGEIADVVDLITEYKSAKGLNKPRVVAGTATPAAAKPVTELPAAAKQAAKALGVVDSKRSAATTNVADPNDFDGAWEEAVGR